MANDINDDLRWLEQLLEALRYGTPREDAELLDTVFARHRLSRRDDLAEQIIEGPGFERFFLDLFQEVQPFALMLAALYEFLASHGTTAGAGSTTFRVRAEAADIAFDFPLDALPRLLHELVGTFRTPQGVLQLRGVVEQRAEAEEDACWGACDPKWDFDFYDHYQGGSGFCRLVSYAPTFMQRASEAEVEECRKIAERSIDLMRALSQALLWLPLATSSDRFQTSWINGELETIPLQVFPPLAFALDRTATVDALKQPVGGTDDGVPILSVPDQRTVWSRREWQLIGFAHCVRIWDLGVVRVDNQDELANLMGRPFDDISPSDYLDQLRPSAEAFEAALEGVVVVTGTQQIEVTARAVLEFVSLPFWQDRPFLYELWTMAHILRQASKRWAVSLVGLNPLDDGVLEWAIPGRDEEASSPVALIEDGVELWAAHSTRSDDGKALIKPDLRLTRADSAHTDLLLIECKDRRSPRRSAIAKIVERYLSGSPAEALCILNADRFSTATRLIAGTYSERECLIFDGFRPPSPSNEVSQRIAAILERELRGPDTEPAEANEEGAEDEGASVDEARSGDEALRISLSWQGADADLDLHGWVTSVSGAGYQVSWRQPSHEDQTWSRLSVDVTQTPGTEVLAIGSHGLSTVVVAVEVFSGPSVQATKPKVHIEGPNLDLWLTPPEDGGGPWWHIGKLDTVGGQFEVANEVHRAAPAAFG